MKDNIIIAIDGPAGSGKSTVSKRVASKLNLLYLDTGAMYRALTLKVKRSGVNCEDKDAIVKIGLETEINLTVKPGEETKVFLDGEDVSGEIRTPEVTQAIKYVACIPKVRERMVQVQRGIAGRKGAVVEGRDIGTVVLPDAKWKIYLDATEEERSRRRHKELKEKGIEVNIDELRAEVKKRDASDMNRKVAPLKRAKDAVLVDTTELSIDQVVSKILKLIKVD